MDNNVLWIDDRYSITQCSYGFVLKERRVTIDEDTFEEKVTDKDIGYHGKISQLLAALYQLQIAVDVHILGNVQKCQELYDKLIAIGEKNDSSL